MPSRATSADQTSAGKGDKSPCNGGDVKSRERALLWRGVANSAAEEDATHTNYFTWEHLIERIRQQGAEDCKHKRKEWSPFGAGEKEKIGLSETTLEGFVERLCEQGPALKEREGLWSTEEQTLGGRDVGPAHAGSHGRNSELSCGVWKEAGNEPAVSGAKYCCRVNGCCCGDADCTAPNRKQSPFLPPSFLSLLRVSRKPGDTEEVSLQNPSCIVTRQNGEGALGAQTPGVYKSCQMPSASAGGVEAGAGAKWSPGRRGAKMG